MKIYCQTCNARLGVYTLGRGMKLDFGHNAARQQRKRHVALKPGHVVQILDSRARPEQEMDESLTCGRCGKRGEWCACKHPQPMTDAELRDEALTRKFERMHDEGWL